MKNPEEGAIPPRPWSLDITDGEVWHILDADGEEVVVTDCGFYPPNVATEELIIRLINHHT